MRSDVPTATLREAFERSGLSASELAHRMGWTHKTGGDASRVRRTLGIRPDIDGHGRREHRESTSGEMASRLLDAMEIDPHEVGL